MLNGIVENYEQLRDELVRRGCTFSSETDAEVVAHLLGCRFAGVDLTAAVRLTCDLLRGHFAFLAMRADDPDDAGRCPPRLSHGDRLRRRRGVRRPRRSQPCRRR